MKRSPLIVILATVFIALVGFGIVIPLLPVYAERYGAGGLEVGLLMMSYSLMQFLLSPWAGRLSDRIGRRPVLVAALAITTASYILLGFANNLLMLYVSRILAGIGGSDITVAQAYIADITTRENRAKGMGLFGSAFGFGFMIGPTLAGILAPIHPELPAFAAAGFSGVTALLALFMLPEPEKHLRRMKTPIIPTKQIPSRIFFISGIYFFAVFAQSMMHSMIVLFTLAKLGWHEKQNGFFLGLMGMVSASIQAGALGYLARWIGQRTLVKIGLVFLGAGLFIVGTLPNVPILVVGGLVNVFGFATVIPTLASLASLESPGETMGKSLGFYQSIGSLARILSPLAGGFLFDYFNPSTPFFTGAVIALLTSLGATLLLRNGSGNRGSEW